MINEKIKVLILVALLGIAPSLCSAAPWWDSNWHGRAKIAVDPNGYDRVNKPVEVSVNFTDLLSDAGLSGSLDAANLRVVEVDGQGNVTDASVAWQFDQDSDYNKFSKASGTLVFMADGQTGSSGTREYYVYFDTEAHAGGKTTPSISSRVSLDSITLYEGEPTYVITTDNAKYYYHREGCGFASMIDTNDNDWISYTPGGGSAGEYRGIPNTNHFGHPGNGFQYSGKHAGTTQIRHVGPLKVTLYSIKNDNQASLLWEIYPEYVLNTVLTMPGKFMWGYEGTPGGVIEPASDFCVWSDGTEKKLSESWHGDLADPEWVYFGDGSIDRIIYLVHHEDDNGSDQYWTMQNNMTVFGFGREYQCCDPYIDIIPGHFSFGFADVSNYSEASKVINSTFRDLSVSLGSGENTSSVTSWNPGASTGTGIQIYSRPNPFTDRVEIALGHLNGLAKSFKVDILNSLGKIVHSHWMDSNDPVLNWNTASMPAGIYFVNMDVSGKTINKKIILIRD